MLWLGCQSQNLKTMEPSEIIDKYNEMLHDGNHSRGECDSFLLSEKYKWENEFREKRGFFPCMDFLFLYPERIFYNEQQERQGS